MKPQKKSKWNSNNKSAKTNKTHLKKIKQEKMKCESVKALKNILYNPWCNPKKNIVMETPQKYAQKCIPKGVP
jgi:hypothetical protein